MMQILYCFFFQAEDGIRDVAVTGVQTCALPIYGGPRDDGVGGRSQLPLRQPGRAGTDGLGGIGVSIRHPGDALVLDRRDSGNVVSRAGDDAVLLHLENPLRSRVFEATVWGTGARSVGSLVRV